MVYTHNNQVTMLPPVDLNTRARRARHYYKNVKKVYKWVELAVRFYSLGL